MARATVKKIELTTTMWVAVRHSADGYDWIDTSSMSHSATSVQAETDGDDKLIPCWAAANPVVRVVQVKIVEVPNG